jgi:hypothetical protein
MAIDLDKIDDTVLGLLWLTLHDENRAWKSFDWGALDRLHQKGLIADPVNKAKSVDSAMKDFGARRSYLTPCSRAPRHERLAVIRGGDRTIQRLCRPMYAIASIAIVHGISRNEAFIAHC